MGYDGVAREYDAAFAWESDPEVILPVWERLGRPTRVLEVACGPARLLAVLVARGVQGVGIDVSRPMLALAREHLDAAGTDFELLEARMEDFVLETPCAGAFCAVGSFGHLSTRDAAGAHLARMHAALKPGARYAVQMGLKPRRDTEAAPPNEHSHWDFDLDGETLRYAWYGTGVDASTMQEVQRSRIEWLTGPRHGEVVEDDHLMAIWDWDGWRELVAASGFEQVAAIEVDDGVRELKLGPGLYDHPVAWHILSR